MSLEAVRGFDAQFFRDRLARALAVRRLVGLVDGESSYRLLNAEGDGLPGFSVDRFGAYAVVCAPSRPLLPFARLLAEATLAIDGQTGVRGVVIKVRGKDPQDRSHKDEILGEQPPEKYVVTELGAPYELHLRGALNVGLFPDMREQRRNIGRFVTGRRVLNTFAYTGALSVAAARAGAAAVTSVDTFFRRAGLGARKLSSVGFRRRRSALPFRGVRRAPLHAKGSGARHPLRHGHPRSAHGLGRARIAVVDGARLPAAHRLGGQAAAIVGRGSCGSPPTPVVVLPCSATSRKASSFPAGAAPCSKPADYRPIFPRRQAGPNLATWKSVRSSSQASNIGARMRHVLLATLALTACPKAAVPVPDAGTDGSVPDVAPAPPDAALSLAVDFTVESCPSFNPPTPSCTGKVPLTLLFVPLATTAVTKYIWDFGDLTLSDSEADAKPYVLGAGGSTRLKSSPPEWAVASVTKIHAQFVVAQANDVGEPCNSDPQCDVDLYCLCSANAPCTTGPALGMCTSSCQIGSCGDNQVCAGLLTTATPPPGGAAPWQTSLCLLGCSVDTDCATGLRCRTLPPGPTGSAWVHGCFADVPEDVGDPCTDAAGAGETTCVPVASAPISAKGLCSMDCSVASCPPGSDCAVLGDGRKLCLRPCTGTFTCSSDPLLTCMVPGPGRSGSTSPVQQT